MACVEKAARDGKDILGAERTGQGMGSDIPSALGSGMTSTRIRQISIADERCRSGFFVPGSMRHSGKGQANLGEPLDKTLVELDPPSNTEPSGQGRPLCCQIGRAENMLTWAGRNYHLFPDEPDNPPVSWLTNET